MAPTNAIVWVNGAGSGSKTYTLSVAGQTVATMQTASTGPVTIPWNTRSVADGSRVLTASVRDAAGKTGSKAVTVTVRNGAVTSGAPVPASPTGGLTVWVTEPTGGETVRGTHWAVVWLNGAAGGSRTFTLSVAGQTVATFTSTSSGPVTIPWNTRSVADGSRALTATVRDPAGKTGSTSVTVTVRNSTAATPPPAGALSVAITQPQNTRIVNGTTSVVVWAEGTNGASNTFTLAVDGVTVGTQTAAVRGPVAIPWNTRSKANGTRTLTATVRDATGRTASTTVTAVVKN